MPHDTGGAVVDRQLVFIDGLGDEVIRVFDDAPSDFLGICIGCITILSISHVLGESSLRIGVASRLWW